jgi:60kDa lysophospholipase
MLVGPQGYVPEPHFLTETLRSQARFHDPFQDSLFSNSASVEGYREWSSGGSGKSSPRSTSPGRPSSPAFPMAPHPTLPVRSSRPIGPPTTLKPSTTIRLVQQPPCKKISDNVYEAHLPSLVTPKSTVPGGGASKRIRYAILEVKVTYQLSIEPPFIRSSAVEPTLGQQQH